MGPFLFLRPADHGRSKAATIPGMAWLLLIDESGNFRLPGETVTVAGVLGRSEDLNRLDRALFEELRALDPLCPWPLHTAHANKLSWLAVAREHQVRKRGPQGPPRLGMAVTAILNGMERALPEETRDLRGSIGRRRSPTWEAMMRLERWLSREAPPALDLSLNTLRDWQADLFGRVTDTVRHQVAKKARRPIWAIVSSESHTGNAMESPLSADRYLALLAVLIERAADVLARAGSHGPLSVRPYGRHVSLPGETEGPFTQRHLLGLLARTELPSTLKVEAGHPGRYPGPTPGAGFLSDLLAHQSRFALRHHGGLSRLHQLLRVRTGLKAWSGDPARSHCAAHYRAREYILAARAGEAPPLANLEGIAPWARSQAEQWSHA